MRKISASPTGESLAYLLGFPRRMFRSKSVDFPELVLSTDIFIRLV